MEVQTKGHICLHDFRALESDVTLHTSAVVSRAFHSAVVRTIFDAVNSGRGRHGQTSFRTLLRAHLCEQLDGGLMCFGGDGHGLPP